MRMKNIILLLLAFSYSNAELDSLINEKKYLEIIEVADNAIKTSADVDDVFFKKASEVALLLDDLDKAIQYLKKSISIKDTKDYRDEWDRIVRMRKDIEIALKRYQEENDYEGAISELESLEYPDCALIDYSIGKIYQQEDEYASALESFKTAVRKNPYREKYSLSINYIIGKFITDGDEYYSMRDFSSALDQYLFADTNFSIDVNSQKVVDEDSLNESQLEELNKTRDQISKKVALKFKIAKTYYFLKEYSDSQEALRYLIALKKDHYEAYKLLGDVLKRLGDRDLALKNYLLAIDANENYEKAYLAVGQMYLSDNNIDGAKKYLLSAIDIKKDYAKAYETLGILYQNTSSYNKAIDNYLKALEYDRRNYKAMSRLASVYNSLEKYDLAKKYAKNCIKVKRSYPDAYYELGIAEKGLGSRVAAIDAFNKAKKSSKWRKAAQYEIDLIKKELD